MSQSNEKNFDAIVIGAGPAGSAAAAVLAEKGRRVALLDKAARDRYSVGESLIPFCWHALDRLGLVEAMDASGFSVPKHSVQFASVRGKISTPFYFFQHTDFTQHFQVLRSRLTVTNVCVNEVANAAIGLDEYLIHQFTCVD